MDVRPGGTWRFVMHGPDGRDYQNQVTYLEVVPPQRLAYKHGGAGQDEPVNFQVVATFDDLSGKTRVTMRMEFPTAAARPFVETKYGAVNGLHETLARLEEQLAKTR